jgi:hypothetical protein
MDIALAGKKMDTLPVPYAQRLKTFSCQGGRLLRGVCFPVYGLAAPAPVWAPVMFPRQRAVIESTSNTAGCLALSLGNVGPPSSMPLRILLPAIGSSGDVHPTIGIGIALKARGHDVIVVTNEIFSGQIRASGTRVHRARLEGGGRGRHERSRTLASEEGIRDASSRRRSFPTSGPSTTSSPQTGTPPLSWPRPRSAWARGSPRKSSACRRRRSTSSRSSFQSEFEFGRLGPFDLGRGKPRLLKRAMFWIGTRVFIDPCWRRR